MCNLYDIGPAPAKQAKGWERRAAEAMEGLPKQFGIRRTDRSLALRCDAATGELAPVAMRWGFRREFSDCINNARTDKLESRTWSEAWDRRRCVIPAAAFYEWSGGERGAKQTYALQDPEAGDWLWMAALWEEAEGLGLCCSMLTREARGPIAEIHDRMPVILPKDHVEAFLAAGSGAEVQSLFKEARSDLRMFPCLNPLKLARPGAPQEEGFLF